MFIGLIKIPSSTALVVSAFYIVVYYVMPINRAIFLTAPIRQSERSFSQASLYNLQASNNNTTTVIIGESFVVLVLNDQTLSSPVGHYYYYYYILCRIVPFLPVSTRAASKDFNQRKRGGQEQERETEPCTIRPWGKS